jgi:dsDNA-binding SOS-regulon protein
MSTVFELAIEGREFRLLVLDQGDGVLTWEVMEAEFEFSEGGDAESGPMGITRDLVCWHVISYGMGNVRRDEMESFVRSQVADQDAFDKMMAGQNPEYIDITAEKGEVEKLRMLSFWLHSHKGKGTVAALAYAEVLDNVLGRITL